MKIKGVTRIEGPEGRGSGWMVRLTRQGKTTHRWFADGQHGGKRAALEAARKHHRKLERAAPKPGTTLGMVTKRNTSGRVGVRLAERPIKGKPRSERYLSYEAFWLDRNGRARTISFGCDKYGKRKALALATIARANKSQDRAWVEAQLKK